MSTTTLPDYPDLRKKSPAFLRAFADMADRLGIDADAIAALIHHESGFNPQARNPTGGATGLMQWMPKTAQALGTSVDEIYGMSAIEQLALVEKTFAPWRGKLAARDVPMVGFGSSWIGKPDSTVAYVAGQKGYDWNKQLDTDGDQQLTLGEVRDHVLRSLNGVGRLQVPSEGSVASSAGGVGEGGFISGLFFALASMIFFWPKKGK